MCVLDCAVLKSDRKLFKSSGPDKMLAQVHHMASFTRALLPIVRW